MTIPNSIHHIISFLVISYCCIMFTSVNAQEHNALIRQLEEYTGDKKAQVGVSVIIDGKDTLTLNNEVEYPMMSVYKLHQAMAVADRLSSESISLDTMLAALSYL